MNQEKIAKLIEVLELGRDAAHEVAQRFHEEMKGYREAEHKQVDKDVADLNEAIAMLEAERALLAAARGMEDPIMIPRGLVGAACHVIRKNMPHSMLLEKLRAYTVGGYGEIAQSPPALAGSQVQAAGDAVDAARYRWLRDSTDSGRCIRAMYEDGQKFPDDVDEAIDLAMRGFQP